MTEHTQATEAQHASHPVRSSPGSKASYPTGQTDHRYPRPERSLSQDRGNKQENQSTVFKNFDLKGIRKNWEQN